jgi:uncharacterized oxidoreductase
MKLTNNTILITGGSSGIGLSLAKRFLALNNKVIITGRDARKLELIKQELPDIVTFKGDLTDKTVLEKLVLFIKEQYPCINVLINNAAVQFNYQFAEDSNFIHKTDYEVAVNLIVPIKLTGLLLPLLLKNENSAIVNVSSGLFIAPKRSASVYCATKAALHSYSKTLRYQLEDTKTKVFEIIPALIDTPMTAGRGSSKLSPEQLTDEVVSSLRANKYEIYFGKTKLLKFISRLSPKLADSIMKNGL